MSDFVIESTKAHIFDEADRARLHAWLVGRLDAGMTKFLVHKVSHVAFSPIQYSVTIHCNQGMFDVTLKDRNDAVEAEARVRETRKEIFDFIALVNKIKLVD